jgi:hypothetical protein
MKSEERLKTILNKKYLIGSRKWGGKTKESDFDFITYRKNERLVFNALYDLGIEFKNNYYASNRLYNYKSTKFKYKGVKINILFYDTSDWDKAMRAINTVTTISKQHDLSDRTIRYLVCEATFSREFEQ